MPSGQEGSIDGCDIMAVRLDAVSKSIKERRVLSDVSFGLRRGSILSLVGPNGAGKTTLIRTVVGLIGQDSGQVRILGREVSAASCDDLRSRVGVQSDGNLYESLTVAENLQFWAGLYSLPSSVAAKRIGDLLEAFALEDRRDSRFGELSKGLRQRVSVARAILSEPEILLLDEPTAGLDPASIRSLYAYLRRVCDTSGLSIMVCTHQLDGVEQITDDVAVLVAGSVVRAGGLEDVVRAEWPTSTFDIQMTVGDAAVPEQIEALPGVGRLVPERESTRAGRSAWWLEVTGDDVIPRVVDRLVKAGCLIYSVTQREHGLEELYFRLTEEVQR